MLLALSAFTSGISLRCVEPMLPQLASEFETSVSAAAVVVTAFALSYSAAVLLVGPLGDRYGKLRIVTIATALAGAASLGCAVAWDLGSLAAMRFVMALFASAPVALGMAYIGDVVPIGERQATIARFIGGSIFGQTLGPLFGGVLTDWTGWRSTFVVVGVVFLLASAILLARTRRAWPAIAPGRFQPLAVHARLLARPAVRWMVGVGIAETFFFFGGYVFLGAFFRERFGLSFTVIGLLLAGYGVGGLLYSFMVRGLMRLLGEGIVVAGGVLGFLLFAVMVFAPDWRWAVPCTIGLGLAFYLIHNTIQTKATEVAPDARGAAVALYASAWSTGQALGVAAMGLAVAVAPYSYAIASFAFGFAVLGVWLRTNLWRLKP